MNAFLEALVAALDSPGITDKDKKFIASLVGAAKADFDEALECARIAERALSGGVVADEREAHLRQVRELLSKHK